MATSGGVVVFLDVNGTRFIQRNSGGMGTSGNQN